tara:strand:- start:39 stop:164 length:126 start_codon:yes stop_codon:yes gene_type:complete
MVKITESFLNGFLLVFAIIAFVALRFYADIIVNRIWEWMNE